jgi:shikimate dehydrogenase
MSRVIDGRTKLLGLIGEGIDYTLSPRLHNRAIEVLGLSAAYLPLSMPAARVQSFLDVAWDLGATGFNVTNPHKRLVASLVDADGLTSVNTVFRGDKGWRGASTDGEGFVASLAAIKRDVTSFKHAVILGAGGAAESVVHALAVAAPALTIDVLRRQDASDAALRRVAGRSIGTHGLDLATLTTLLANKGDDTLLIQATNAPHRGDDLASLVPALASYGGVVIDLVYGKPSALYFAALAKDLTAQDGEPMLIEQARLAQKLWWGKSASYDELRAALKN